MMIPITRCNNRPEAHADNCDMMPENGRSPQAGLGAMAAISVDQRSRQVLGIFFGAFAPYLTLAVKK